MQLLNLAMLTLALLGHAAIWIGAVNRIHSTGWPRRVVKIIAQAFYAALYAIPAAILLWWMTSESDDPLGQALWRTKGVKNYLVVCSAFGALHTLIWARDKWHASRPLDAVRLDSRHVIDLEKQLGASLARGARAKLFMHVPGNQIWQLEVCEYSLTVPALPRELAGLSICHWSDFHFSGRIDRAYFEEVVRLTNAMHVDLIALTGDICDKAGLISWIPELLGPAQARLGKFFILGNHDLRTHDVPRLRGAMREAGFIDLGGHYQLISNERILIAGDERPWFRHMDELPPPPESGPPPLRILLSHAPDRLRWAQLQGFDLMLAGHTHGGQIRFPLIGPVVCPSWYGTRYASGFFDEPPTLLHVNRGTAGLFPLRIDCRPELSKLVLTAT